MAYEYLSDPTNVDLQPAPELATPNDSLLAKKTASLAQAGKQKAEAQYNDFSVDELSKMLGDLTQYAVHERKDTNGNVTGLYQTIPQRNELGDWQVNADGSRKLFDVPFVDKNRYGNPNTRDFYIRDTVTQDNLKFGVERTDQAQENGRYKPKGSAFAPNAYNPQGSTKSYDGTPGPLGVQNPEEDPLMRISLPYEMATKAEELLQLNKGRQEFRSATDEQLQKSGLDAGMTKEELAQPHSYSKTPLGAQYGGGVSEYTKNDFWNVPKPGEKGYKKAGDVRQILATEFLNKPDSERKADTYAARWAQNAERDGRITESAKAAGSMLIKEFMGMVDFVADNSANGAYKLAQVLGMDELGADTLQKYGFQKYKNGDINYRRYDQDIATKVANDITGYDSAPVEAERKVFTDKLSKIYHDDKMGKAEKTAATLGELLSNPELIPTATTESLAYVATMLLGGSIKLLKVGKQAGKVAKTFDQGKEVVTKVGKVASPEKLKALTSVAPLSATRLKNTNKLINKTLKTQNYITARGLPAALSEANKILEERRANNDGKASSVGEIAGVTALAGLYVKLDSLATVGILKGKANLSQLLPKKQITQAMNVATKEEADRLLKTSLSAILIATGKAGAKGTLNTAGSAVVEGTTEGLQELIQIYAKRFGTEDFKNKDFLGMGDKTTVDQIIAAVGMGALVGGGMKGVGALAEVATPALNAAAEKRLEGQLIQSQKDKADKIALEEGKAQTDDIIDTEIVETEVSEAVQQEVDEEIAEEFDGDTIEDLQGDAASAEEGREPSTITLEELIEINVDEEASPEKQEAFRRGMRKRLEAMGMLGQTWDSKELKAQALQDKKDGLLIGEAKGASIQHNSQKKEKRLNPEDITDTMLEDIGNDSFNEEDWTGILKSKTESKLLSRIKKAFGLGSEAQKTIKTVSSKIKSMLFDKNGKATQLASLKGLVDTTQPGAEGKVLGMIAMASAAAKGAIQSEYHLTQNAGGKHATESYGRLAGTIQQLGKDYMNRYGLEYRGNPKAVARRNAKIGMQIMKLAEEAGVVEISRKMIVAPELVRKDGKNVTTVDDFKDLGMNARKGPNGTILVEKSTVRLLDDTTTGEESSVNSKTANGLSHIARVLRPSNYEVPSHETSEEVLTHKPVSDRHEDIIKKYQQLKYSINPAFLELLVELKETIYGKDGKGDFDAALRSNKQLQELLDLKDTKAGINADTESGHKLSRQEALRSLLDNLDYFTEDEFAFSYESAINQRIHVLQTVLDYQGDKFMARQLLTGGEYEVDTTTDNGKKFLQVMVDGIIDATKLTSEQILNPEGALKNALGAMTDGKLSLKNLLFYRKELQKMTDAKGKSLFSGMNAFEINKTLAAIKDINEGNGGTITSNYMVEFDATASGVFNTLLNLSNDPAIQAVLFKLGVEVDGKSIDPELKQDPYKLLRSSVKETEAYKTKGSDLRVAMDAFEDVGIDNRDLAKYVVMTWFYGQSDPNTAKLMGHDASYDLARRAINENNANAVAEINRVLATQPLDSGESANVYSVKKTGKLQNISQLTEEDLQYMTEYYTEVMGDVFVAELNTTFPGIREYSDKMAALFNIMEETNEWNGTLGTAMAALEGTPNKNKMSTQKLKTYADDNYYLNVPFNNSTSLKVNPQHATDAALLLESLATILTGKDLRGVMSVHDAVYANPMQALKIKETYDNKTVEVAGKYDYIQTAINEAKTAVHAMPSEITATTGVNAGKKVPNAAKDTLQKKLHKIEKEFSHTVRDKRRKYLKKITVDVFGAGMGQELAPEVKEVVEEEVVEEVVEEPTPEPEATVVPNEKTALEDVTDRTEAASTVDNLFELTQSDEYAVFDTETTGTEKDARVFQIHIRSHGEGKTYYFKLEGKEHYETIDIDGKPTEVLKGYKAHGMTRKAYEKALKSNEVITPEEAYDKFREITEGNPAVAHKAMFDVEMMSRYDERFLKEDYVDTLKIARDQQYIVPGEKSKVTSDNKQTYLFEKVFNLGTYDAHDAEADVQALDVLIFAMANEMELTPNMDIISEFKKLIKRKEVGRALHLLSMFTDSEPHKEFVKELEILYTKNYTDFELSEDKDGYMAKAATIIVPAKRQSHPDIDVEDTIEGLIETLRHEAQHTVDAYYTFRELKKGKNASGEIKYFKRVLKKLIGLQANSKAFDAMSKEARMRVEYIVSPLTMGDREHSLIKAKGLSEKELHGFTPQTYVQWRSIVEMTAILEAEPDVAKEILNAINVDEKLTISMLQKFLDAVIKMYKDLTYPERSKLIGKEMDINSPNIRIALDIITHNAVVADTLHDPKFDPKEAETLNLVVGHPDPVLKYRTATNPAWIAHQAIESSNRFLSKIIYVLGGYTYDISAIGAEKLDKKLSGNSLYDGTVNLLRTGFYDNKFVDKMKIVLSASGDVNEKLMQDFNALGTQLMQESQTILSDDMVELDKSIQAKYSEAEQIKMYKIWAKTGIADIDYTEELTKEVMFGTKKIDTMISETSEGMTAEDIQTAKELAEFYVNGVNHTGVVNTAGKGTYRVDLKALTALYALEKVDGSLFMIRSMDTKMRDQMWKLVQSVKSTTEAVHLNADSKIAPTEAGSRFSSDFDGNYMKDVHSGVYEYVTVDERDLYSSVYSEENGWKIVRKPGKGTIGIVARELLDHSFTPGVGLNINHFSNGFFMERKEAQIFKKKLALLSPDAKAAYLNTNSIVEVGNRYRFILTEKEKIDNLSLVQNAAQSLYRTMVHNKELIEAGSVRKLLVESATETYKDENGIVQLEATIAHNRKVSSNENKVELPLFIKLDYKYGSYEQLPASVRRRYETATNITTYNGTNKQVTLVRSDIADVVTGHQNQSFFGGTNYRKMAKAEMIFKKLIIMAKQKMVVANPLKLTKDLISNIGILAASDVGFDEIYNGFSRGYRAYTDFSKLRGEIVKAKLDVLANVKGADAKLAKLIHKMEGEEFYDAFKAGYIQSYSTDLVMKDFDTVSGIQQDIEDIAKYISTDKKGDPNFVHKSISWWMDFGAEQGLTVDGLIGFLSRVAKNGGNVQEEMKRVQAKLKGIRDKKDIGRYITEIIGGPASEVVLTGGSFMVLTDALSKYTLAMHYMRTPLHPVWKKANASTPVSGRTATYAQTFNKPTRQEAFKFAHRPFLIYSNMPAEIKALSDYGILMFPSFWMRIQKVIFNLATYHPATAITGFTIESMLDLHTLNVMDANIISKLSAGTVINDPTSIISGETFWPWPS